MVWGRVSIHNRQPCIVVLCNNRPELLKGTLKSILGANGVTHDDIYVSQNGNDRSVHDVISSSDGLVHWVNTGNDKDTKAERLANHFKWTFDKVFHDTTCPGVIVIEDDLIMSPDFMSYFKITIPVVDNDPNLLTASLWNDLGLKDNVNDMRSLKRVNFFSGLGWYLSRDTWNDILGPKWPKTDWDWYVRDVAAKLSLDTVVPEVSRDYHASNTGTYMTKSFFNQYFKDVKMADDQAFEWVAADTVHVASRAAYRKHLITQMVGGDVMFVKGFAAIRNKNLVNRRCEALLRDTALWAGETERGSWNGVHVLWSKRLDHYIYIVDVGAVGWMEPTENVKVYVGLDVCNEWGVAST
jgi:hypothetical protein